MYKYTQHHKTVYGSNQNIVPITNPIIYVNQYNDYNMAARIPTQNNLNDVIKASTELLKEVREAISSRKKQKKDTSTNIKTELTHLKTDVQFVIEFVKDVGDITKNIDGVTDKLVAVLGMPSKINKKLANIKVESINTENIQKATTELKGVLNIPAEINQILASKSDTIKWGAIQATVNQLLLVCRIPEYINKRLNSFKVESIDQKRINTIKQSLDSIFGKDGLVDNIEKIAKTLQEIDNLSIATLLVIPIKIELLGRIVRRIITLMGDMDDLNSYLPTMTILMVTFTVVNKALIKLTSMMDAINKFNLSTMAVLIIKVPIITQVTRMILKQIIPAMTAFNHHLKEMVIAITGLTVAEKLITKLSDIIQVIAKVKLATLIINLLKIKLLAINARRIGNLIIRIGQLANVALRYAAAMVGLSVVLIMVTLFSNIVLTIHKTKIGIFFGIKVRQLILGARLIRNLVNIIAGLIGVKRAAKAMLAIKLVNMIIKSFASVILNILLLTPLMALFIIFAPVIIAVFWLFAKIFHIIVYILAKLVSPRVVIVLVAVTGIITLMAVLGIALVALGLISLLIVDNALNILLFFGVVIAVALLLGLLGFVLTKVSPLLLAAIYGIGMVALAVFAVLAIAAMLWLLAKIELDEEKIRENVRRIMSTVLFIITSLFETELNDPKSKDNAFTKILKIIGGSVAKIVAAIATCAILVATFVSVTCILMIAAMLSLLQNLELNPGKILANVDSVFDTVERILARFMADDPEGRKSNRGFMITLMTWAYPPVAKIADALLSFAYLFLMFLTVTMVLGIATMLRLLQNLNLQTDKIDANIEAIFNTVDKIISRIFGDHEDKENKSDRGILVTIVSWFDEGLAKIVEASLSVIYLALAFIAITLVLAIASLLRLLQNLDLQPETIKKKVDAVFNTVEQLINRIFGNRKDEEHPSSRGILVSIISWADPGLANIVEAALSVVYLMLALTAVAMILGIAGLLKALQEIDLKIDKIKANVDGVFDTVEMIINRVFGDRKDEEHPSSRGILVSIISWVDPSLANIVEAALSVVYLMLALTSITIVLGIAGLLRALQEIDLQFDVISNNINCVFDTVDLIINRVFAPAEGNIIPGHSVLGKIIGLFNPNLAKIIDALMAISYVSLIFVATSIVYGVVKTLEEIQNLNFDGKTVVEKVDAIFKTVSEIMEKVYGKSDILLPKLKDRSIFSSIISFFSPGLVGIVDALTMIARLAVIQAAISAVAGIGNALKQIQDIPTDITSAVVKVDQVMSIAESVCEKIFSRESKIKFPVPPEEHRSVFGALISWAFGGESDEERALEAAMKKVESLGIIEAAVGALGNILEAAKRIADIKVDDLTGAQAKVDQVMEMATHLAESIFSSKSKLTLPEPSNDEVQAALIELGFDHWWRSAKAGEIASAKAQASMKLAMQRVQTLGLIASAVGSIASIIEGIDKIKNYNVPNFTDIRQKVQEVMSAASQVSFVIFNQESIGQAGGTINGIKKQIEEIKARIEFAKTGSDGVGLLCESFASLIEKTKFDEVQIDATKTRVSSAISAIGEIISQMDSIQPIENGQNIRNNCELMDRISKTVGSFVQVTPDDVRNSKEITENYIKFFKQVDSMDLKKLQHTDWLMRSWASISRDLQGDFDGLAKTINQHIMPMLEKVNETLDKTTKTQQEIINVLSQPVNINGGGMTPTTIDSPNDPSNPNNTTSSGGGVVDPGGTNELLGKADATSQQGKGLPVSSAGNIPAPAGRRQSLGGNNTHMETGQKTKKYRIEVIDVAEGW